MSRHRQSDDRCASYTSSRLSSIPQHAVSIQGAENHEQNDCDDNESNLHVCFVPAVSRYVIISIYFVDEPRPMIRASAFSITVCHSFVHGRIPTGFPSVVLMWTFKRVVLRSLLHHGHVRDFIYSSFRAFALFGPRTISAYTPLRTRRYCGAPMRCNCRLIMSI